MSFFGPLTGKLFDSREAMEFYESQERQRRGGLVSQEEAELTNALDTLPPERVKALEDWYARKRQDEHDAGWRQTVGDQFIASHPEYIDNPHNANVLTNELRHAGIFRNPTISQVGELWERAMAAGIVQVDAAKLAEQEQEARIKEAEQRDSNTRMPDDAALEKMDLDELRQNAYRYPNARF